MYSLSVRSHFMIAHSLKGDVFGPAQRLHGATYVADAIFCRRQLDANGLVVDIGLAQRALQDVLADFNYKNLDEESEFDNINTTTEMLAGMIFNQMVEKIKAGCLGLEAKELSSMKIKLRESHIAWGSFESDLTGYLE